MEKLIFHLTISMSLLFLLGFIGFSGVSFFWFHQQKKPLRNSLVELQEAISVPRSMCHGIPNRTPTPYDDILRQIRITSQNKTLQRNIIIPAVRLYTMGGIGNQLFKFACNYALARDLGLPLYMDTRNTRTRLKKTYDLGQYSTPICPIPDLERSAKSQNVSTVHIGDLELLERSFFNRTNHKIGNSLLTTSYCQSLELWIHYAADIRQIFRQPRPDILNRTKMKGAVQFIRNSSPSVAIHVRRGDFVYLGGRDIPFSYYRRAVHKMKRLLQKRHGMQTTPTFFVFGDDLKFVRKQLERWRSKEKFVFLGDRFTPMNTVEDFTLMSMCQHIIFAQSTFSWWGAFLMENPDKIVITSGWNPEYVQLREGLARIYGKLFFPKEWILMSPFNGAIG